MLYFSLLFQLVLEFSNFVYHPPINNIKTSIKSFLKFDTALHVSAYSDNISGSAVSSALLRPVFSYLQCF